MQSVLFVCTANICRSPFAERLAGWLLPDLAVASAGVTALEGRPMDPPMAGELLRRGVSPRTDGGRQVEAMDLDADLVLVMSHRHRRPLIEERPDAVDRIGLLTSLPRLAEQVGDRVVTRRDVAAWARGSFDRPGVPDPFQRGPEAAAQAAATIEQNVEILADLIAPPDLAVFIDGPTPSSQEHP